MKKTNLGLSKFYLVKNLGNGKGKSKCGKSLPIDTDQDVKNGEIYTCLVASQKKKLQIGDFVSHEGSNKKIIRIENNGLWFTLEGLQKKVNIRDIDYIAEFEDTFRIARKSDAFELIKYLRLLNEKSSFFNNNKKKIEELSLHYLMQN